MADDLRRAAEQAIAVAICCGTCTKPEDCMATPKAKQAQDALDTLCALLRERGVKVLDNVANAEMRKYGAPVVWPDEAADDWRKLHSAATCLLQPEKP